MTEANLQGKFNALKDTLAEQHGVIVGKLNDILEGLGVVPETTLTDVVAAINALSGVVAVGNSRLLSLDTTLNIMSLNLETMVQNNSLNAQRILGALALLDPCRDCDIAIDEPAIGINPVTINTVHCQRMQLLLDVIRNLLVKVDSLVRAGVEPSITIIARAVTNIAEGTFGFMGLVPPSVPELSYLIVGMITYASAIFFGGQLPVQDAFDLIKDQLLPLLYAADTASEGRAVYIEFVDDFGGITSVQKQIIKGVAYIGLFNYLYDSTTTVDLGDYDGNLCGGVDPDPQECYELNSFITTITYPPGTTPASHTRYASELPGGYTTGDTFTAPGGGVYTYDEIAFLVGDFEGWRVRKISGGNVRWWGVGVSNNWLGGAIPNDGSYLVINVSTSIFGIDNWTDNAISPGSSFVVELCIPEEI